MKTVANPSRQQWAQLSQRPTQQNSGAIIEQVQNIIEDLKRRGDTALREYTTRLDGVTPRTVKLSSLDLRAGAANVTPQLVEAIKTAANNIRRFHQAQLRSESRVETLPGVTCWSESRPIESIGLYIPAGSAPLFSTLLMLAIPAQIAGCPRIALCSPPQSDGNLDPTICACAEILGLSEVYLVGGAQAIAALAFGTQTIPAVNKIFGPGNSYVTTAKQLVALQAGVGIDLPAGPTELLILADHSARPDFVAADLLSQAEHGADSQVVLVTTDTSLPAKVQIELTRQLASLPRQQVATQAIDNSLNVMFDEMPNAIEFTNYYAPEHLIMTVEEPLARIPLISAAGSVFIGNYAPESAGDYASGTNHVLPTAGYARVRGGVRVDDFCKSISFQELTRDGIRQLAPTIVQMARGERLLAHAQAAEIRVRQIEREIERS